MLESLIAKPDLVRGSGPESDPGLSRSVRPAVLGLLAVLALAGALAAPAQQPASFVVIAHPQVPVSSVSRKHVSQLLLKEVSKWEGGLAAQPVDLDSKSPVRDAFSRHVHGRSVSSIKNYWLRKIFSGTEEPPPEVNDDSAAISYVRSHPGSIGYVSSQAKLSGVKVLDLGN